MNFKKGSNSFFLTEPEKERVRNWRYCASDNSISTQLLTPFWNWCLEWIPDTVAPNILTLAGLLCLFQSIYLTYYKYEQNPRLIGLLNILLIFAYQTLDALDGKQARKTKNGSPVGELFDHACDSIGTICIVLTMCITFGIQDSWTQWLLVNLAEILFMTEHLETLVRHEQTVVFPRWTGPGEVILTCLTLLGVNLFIPVRPVFWSVVERFVSGVSGGQGLTLFQVTLGACLIIATLRAAFIAISRAEYSTRNGVLLCLCFRFLTAYFTYDLKWMDQPEGSELMGMDVLCDGLFWAILSGDLILCKMAGRDLHPVIVLFSMASLLNNWLIPVFLGGYYLSVFSCLLEHCGIPMFGCVRTCYVNGVFDLGHYNHMRMFQQALEVSGCNRLIVGVMSDTDVRQHKGEQRPIDGVKDRVAFVTQCKAVSEVIPDAPWNDVPKEFIEKHNIHIVAHSDEYSPQSEDYCYQTPWDMNIVRLMPRGDGISTSARVQRLYKSFKSSEPTHAH